MPESPPERPSRDGKVQRHAGAHGSWPTLFATLSLALGGPTILAPSDPRSWAWLVVTASVGGVAWLVARHHPRPASWWLWLAVAGMLVALAPLYGGHAGTSIRALPIVVAFAFETLGARAGAFAALAVTLAALASWAVERVFPGSVARWATPEEHLVTGVVVTLGAATLIVLGMRQFRSALDESRRIRRDRDHALSERDAELARREALEEALRAARDEALSASHAKSAFLATMSHELRTPLNAVIGYSEMLIDASEDPETRSDLERIRSAGRHLLTLIDDVLDLSKVEAGRMKVLDEDVSLHTLLAEIVETVRPMMRDRGNELRARLPSELGWIRTDGTRLRQILLNLLSNSSKFTDAGTVTLTVSRASSQGNDLVRFEVADTGIGISDAVLARLFRPFVQGDASTRRKFGGTGLGLALSARIARLLGGSIDVTSVVGEGSTFTLTLPAQSARSQIDALAAERRGAVERGVAEPVVLCVDDEPEELLLLERLLDGAGFHVVPCVDPEHAATWVRELRPAVLTLDLHMPEVDGFTVLEQLGQDAPAVIVVSVDDERTHPRALGVSAWLRKPVDREGLVEALRAGASRPAAA